MSATISIVVNYGTTYTGYEGEAGKNIFYLLPVDSGILNRTTNPLRKPESGTIYSYEKYIRCRLDSPPVTRCYNFKVWYVSGMPSPGQTLKVNSDIVTAYVAPVDSESSRGNRVDFTTKNAEGNSIVLSGELTDIGDYTSYLVYQLAVASTANLGNFEVSWIVQYDEQ